MSLTGPAISETTVESATLTLLDEWLAGYFDGGLHAVGLKPPVRFPSSSLKYGQSKGGQPLGDLIEIRTVLLPRSETALSNDNALYTGRLVQVSVLLNFWISSKKRGTGQAMRAAQEAAQLLHAILANPDTRYPLAEKGITTLLPQAPQTPLSWDTAERLVACSAVLQYPVEFAGTGALVTPPSTVSFTQEAVLIADSYLLGRYEWDVPVNLRSAQVTAWASAGVPAVLELEVGGELTGKQLVIPVGEPNTDVEDRIVLDVDVAAGQVVRWKVVSAPALPEDSAWHVAVSVQTSAD